jgi:hypothetical protein
LIWDGCLQLMFVLFFCYLFSFYFGSQEPWKDFYSFVFVLHVDLKVCFKNICDLYVFNYYTVIVYDNTKGLKVSLVHNFPSTINHKKLLIKAFCLLSCSL